MFIMTIDNEFHYFHFTYRDRLDIIAHVEMEQLGRNRWRVTIDGDESIVRTKAREPFEVLSAVLAQDPPLTK